VTTPHSVRAEARDKTRQRGEWILADAELQLLSVGDRLYPGTSWRSALDFVSRKALLPQMRAALATGKPRTAVVMVDDRRWAAQATPILSPLSEAVLAVLGCYDAEGQQLPAAPLVGSWEWVVTPPGPDQRLQTFWSPQMYQVYGIPHLTRAWWDGPQWLDELVSLADRPALRALFETFVADTEPVLRIRSFTASPPTGEHHALRVAGRCYQENGHTSLRGITARLHDHNVEPQPSHLAAVLALSRDPIVMIDPRYEVIYLTPASFGDLGLVLPNTRNLLKMCHTDDIPTLRGLLRAATAQLEHTHGPAPIRFSAANGGWLDIEVLGTAVQVTTESIHVWCRFRRRDHR
jgi:hypothetical protein